MTCALIVVDANVHIQTLENRNLLRIGAKFGAEKMLPHLFKLGFDVIVLVFFSVLFFYSDPLPVSQKI